MQQSPEKLDHCLICRPFLCDKCQVIARICTPIKRANSGEFPEIPQCQCEPERVQPLERPAYQKANEQRRLQTQIDTE